MHMGPLHRVIFPYEYLFRCVNTHLYVEQPLTHDLATDKQMIYGALAAGHCFVGYDLDVPHERVLLHGAIAGPIA